MEVESIKTIDFLFIYEVKARELDTVCLLAAQLKKNGYTVDVINSWDRIEKKQMNLYAKVIVLSACYDDGTYSFFTSFIRKFDKVVDLQWEQVLQNRYEKGDKTTSWTFSGIALNTRHICWGQKTADRLIQQYNISNSCLCVTGYVPLDFYRVQLKEVTPSREELFIQHGLSTNKKTLLFVSSFSEIDLPKDLCGFYEGQTESQQNAALERARSTRDTILEWFKKALHENPQLQIVYRPHPSEIGSVVLQYLADTVSNFFYISDMGIRAWITNCDIIYNWVSSSMIEMYACNKLFYILRPYSIPYEEDLPYFKNCNYIQNYEEFVTTLAVQSKEYQIPVDVDLLLSYYSIEETPAYKNVCDFLINAYKDKTYRSPVVHEYMSITRYLWMKFRETKLHKIIINWCKKSNCNLSFVKARCDYETNSTQVDLEKLMYNKEKTRQNSICKRALRQKTNKMQQCISKNIDSLLEKEN